MVPFLPQSAEGAHIGHITHEKHMGTPLLMGSVQRQQQVRGMVVYI